MIFDNGFECIPNFRTRAVNHLSCGFDVGCRTCFNKAFHNERLKQFKRHFLRKTALIDFKFRTYNDNRTAWVVNTLTEQVLSETALFTFEHMREGFEFAVVRTGYRSTAAAVVDECVNCFLEHSLLVTHDNVRRSEFEKSFQTVVTVDNSSVKVV